MSVAQHWRTLMAQHICSKQQADIQQRLMGAACRALEHHHAAMREQHG
jgi:hypothetical protein